MLLILLPYHRGSYSISNIFQKMEMTTASISKWLMKLGIRERGSDAVVCRILAAVMQKRTEIH